MTENLLLVLLVILFAILSLLLYLRTKKYQKQLASLSKTVSGNTSKNDSFSEDIRREHTFNDLAFKIDLVIQSGKTALWDFDVKAGAFTFMGDHTVYVKDFTMDQLLKLVHPEDIHVVSEFMQNLIDGKNDIQEFSYRIQTPGKDEYRCLDIIAVVYHRDNSGKVTAISGLQWDITDSLNEKRRMEENKSMLEMSLCTGNIITWTLDSETHKMESENERSIFYQKNYTSEEYIEAFVHSDYKQKVINEVDNILSGKTDKINIKFQAYYDNQYEWIHITGREIYTPITHTRKILGIAHFITEDVKKQEELILLRKKAEESNYMKSTFLANMGHEIRTPLNAIIGFSRLIAESQNSENNQEFVRIIESNNDLLQQLVNDILDISKIEAGQMNFNFSNADICKIFTDLHQTYSYKMPENVELILSIPEKSYTFYTERNRVIQVLCNFLNNAIKYTSQGSITMGYTRDESGIRLFVKDTGKGIVQENLPDIFKRFAKFNPEVPGTGLGLSICEGIVLHLSGKIGVESELESGSEFWFYLPEIKTEQEE